MPPLPDGRALLARAAGTLPATEVLVGAAVFLSAYLSMLATYVPGGITLGD